MEQRHIKACRAAKTMKMPVSSTYRKLMRENQSGSSPDEKTRKSSPVPDDKDIQNKMKEIKRKHPYWGYRRVRAKLRKEHNIVISRKRANALMRKANLLCPKKAFRQKRKHISQPVALQPKKAWQIDMTSFVLANLTTLYLIIVIDVFSRKIVGWHLGMRCRAKEWTAALDKAVLAEFPDGVRGRGLVLRADNGSQPTSRMFTQHLKDLDITGQWIAYNCPESNAYVERVIRTVKEEVIWPNDFDSFQEAFQSVSSGISEYNNDYPHSSLLYMSPNEILDAWMKGDVCIETYRDNKGRTKRRFVLSKNAA